MAKVVFYNLELCYRSLQSNHAVQKKTVQEKKHSQSTQNPVNQCRQTNLVVTYSRIFLPFTWCPETKWLEKKGTLYVGRKQTILKLCPFDCYKIPIEVSQLPFPKTKYPYLLKQEQLVNHPSISTKQYHCHLKTPYLCFLISKPIYIRSSLNFHQTRFLRKSES